MTVYCIQEPPGTADGNPRYNVMKALPFGDVKFLFTERAQLVYSAGSLIHKIRKKLERFNDEDFLLLVGDPAIIAVAAVVASGINNGKFKLLKWDRIAGKYYPLSIDLYNKEKEDE
tara:strand:+ start:380 stop:727 length:348 start_codon:yes stop_codon:yes gene_type:complete